MLSIRHIGALLFTLAAQLCASTAQSSDWRDEDIGSPSVRSVRTVDGVYLASTYKGLYQWDPVSESWIFTNSKTREVDLERAAEQRNGILTWHTDEGLTRYDVHRGTFEYRSLRYHVEANDTIVGVVAHTGTDPEIVRVAWLTLNTLDTLQVDTHTLSSKFWGSGIPCADGSLVYKAGADVVSFKYGRDPSVIKDADDEEYSSIRAHLRGATTHLVMQNRNSVIASSDHGLTWRTIRTGRSRSYTQIAATHLDDEFYAVETYTTHVLLRGDSTYVITNDLLTVEPGAAGGHGWLVHSSSDLRMLSITDPVERAVNVGLPPGGVWNAYSLRGGVAALSDRGLTVRAAYSTWTFPFEEEGPPVHELAGGTSIDDIWIVFYSGWEQATYARADRHGGMRDHRDVSLVNMSGGMYWDVGDSAFCYAIGGDIYLHRVNGNHWLVQKDAEPFVFLPFGHRAAYGISASGTKWSANGDLSSWRAGAIPSFPVCDWLFGREYLVSENNAFLRCKSYVLLTRDHGVTWELITLKDGEVLTIGRTGVIYRAELDLTRGGYHITSTQDGVSRTIAVLPADSIDHRLAALQGMRVDDDEGRLFAYSSSWIRSIALPPVSTVSEIGDHKTFDRHAPVEIYDLCGRSVGVDVASSAMPRGTYLVVQQGVTHLMLLPIEE